jgi:hypothetical protein
LDDAKKAAGHDDRTGGHRHRLTVLVLSNRDKARRHRCSARASPGKQFPPPWKLKPNGVRGGGLDGLRTPLPRSVLAARARLAAPSPPNREPGVHWRRSKRSARRAPRRAPCPSSTRRPLTAQFAKRLANSGFQ